MNKLVDGVCRLIIQVQGAWESTQFTRPLLRMNSAQKHEV